MAWLSSWLKEIIVIILIATFADLLLPNKSMQRYVKTVIGLFILLVLLSPILQLFRSNWDPETLIRAAEMQAGQSASTQTADGTSEAGGRSGSSLETIYREGERLKAADREQARGMVERQLAESVRTGIERRLGYPVADVAVKTGIDKEDRLMVKGVTVVLAEPGGPQEAKVGSSGMKPVEPVRPVTVDLPPLAERSEPLAADEADEADAFAVNGMTHEADEVEPDGKDAAMLQQVREWISTELQVEPGAVMVSRRAEHNR